MNILHICAAFSPSSGVTEFVAHLALHQQRQGNRVRIATLGEGQSASIALAENEGVEICRFPFSFPAFLFFSWKMARGLKKNMRGADVVHVHSNWTFPVWWSCWLALRFRKKLVMSPHGCLDPVRLRHSRWKKRCVGWMDRWFLRRAHVIHATPTSEANWVREYVGGNGKARIQVIPYGIQSPVENEAFQRRTPCEKKRVVYLGRLHPLKGLDLLIKSWSNLTPLHENWELVIVGPNEQETVEKLKSQMADQSIVLTGSAHDDAKWRMLAGADVFVLPSRSENFGIVVGEALGCGVPVVVAKGAPWAEVEKVGCGYWVDVSVEGIADGLSRMMRLSDEERRTMGTQGKAWVQQDFNWGNIAQRMLDVYRT